MVYLTPQKIKETGSIGMVRCRSKVTLWRTISVAGLEEDIAKA